MRLILTILLAGLFVSCGGGGGGGDPHKLDERLFSGTGTWELSYVDSGLTYYETLVFSGADDCQYTKTFTGNLGQSGTVFDKHLILTATGKKKIKGINTADESEVWEWNYLINGTTLRLCDEDDWCYELEKQ